MRILPFLDDTIDDVAVALGQALGHLPYAVTSDQVLRASLGQVHSSRESARLYALGMTGSPALAALVGSATTPPWLREGARWWMDLGPGIFA